jgi:hypothetical protein
MGDAVDACAEDVLSVNGVWSGEVSMDDFDGGPDVLRADPQRGKL